VGVVPALHPNKLTNLFIAMPIMAEGREKFCFQETKKDDFSIFFSHSCVFIGFNRQNSTTAHFTLELSIVLHARPGIA
jgi:hypothetical protein